ncbi:MFS transporter [Streptomyces sp. NPDC059982]|uniref:MFS transporter n=1 Tax=unclassified Streptomyces TaxID=2593676 RepID=UPI003695E740
MSAPAAAGHRKEPEGALRLLARAPVRGLLALAFSARTTAAVLPITLLLALAQTHGYARAATVGGGYTLVLAFCAPLRGRLLDRYGARRVLWLMGAVTAVLLGLVACSVEFRWPWWTTLPLVITATLASPPLSAALRAAWRRLAASEAQLKAVHSADSILEEAGYVLAPLAAGTAVVVLGPVRAYEAAAAAFITVTALYLAAARRHQLTIATHPRENRPPSTGVRRRARWWLGPLATPGVPAILTPLLAMGAVFGGTGILIPAYTQHQHATVWLGPLLAAISAGGVIGGILYATLDWKTSLWRKYQILTLGFTLPNLFLFLARPLWLLATLLLIAGLFVTPLFINAFLLVDATATDETRIEANTWIGASTDIANGIMAVTIGTLTEHQRWDTALLTLTTCAAAGTASTLLAPTRRTPAPSTRKTRSGSQAPLPGQSGPRAHPAGAAAGAGTTPAISPAPAPERSP